MLSGGPAQWPQPPPVPAGRSRCCVRRCGECGRRAGPRGPGIGASGPRRPPQHAAPEERLSPLVHLEPRRRHVSVTPNPRDAAGGVCEVRVPRSARSRRRRAPPLLPPPRPASLGCGDTPTAVGPEAPAQCSGDTVVQRPPSRASAVLSARVRGGGSVPSAAACGPGDPGQSAEWPYHCHLNGALLRVTGNARDLAGQTGYCRVPLLPEDPHTRGRALDSHGSSQNLWPDPLV